MSAGARRADVLVVGGGVIGLAVADALAAGGRRVLVLDESLPRGPTSPVAGGMLAPVSEAEGNASELTRFGLQSLERFPAWIRDLERRGGLTCGYRDEGTLWIALDRDDAEALERLRGILHEAGHRVAAVDAAGLRRREPRLGGRVQGGLLVPGDHQVDPRRLLEALAAALGAVGGELRGGLRVEAVLERGGRVTGVRTAGGARWHADTVVLATGAWSSRALEVPGWRPAVRPVKGQLVRLRGERLLDHVVRTPRAYLIPRVDGELLVGATSEELGFDDRPRAGAVLELLREAWEALPGVAELDLAEVSVGLRSATADHLPVIGESPDVAGLYLAVGHYRNGILLAPATAALLAQWIEEGRRPQALAPFAPGGARSRKR